MAKKKSNRTLYIVGGIAVVIIAGVLIAKAKGWIGGEKPTEVIVAKAQKLEIVEKVSASGKIQPEVEVKITPDVPGEIRELWVKEGDSVSKGQLLIKIRPDNYQSVVDRTTAGLNTERANVAQSAARVAQAEAQYNRARSDYERTQKLYNQKIVSEAELETALSAFRVAKSDMESAKQSVEAARFRVKSAEASVKEANENLSLTSIFAPMSGTVSKLVVEKGERVVGTSQMAGTEMLRIANLNSMEVSVDVNENDIIRVKVGDTAIVDVDSYSYTNQKFKGLVTSIANSAKDVAVNSDAVTEFEVKIRILNESYSNLVSVKSGSSPFRPGMTASVEILTQRKSGVLAVPLSAVTTRSSNPEEEGKEKKEDEEEGKKENTDDKKARKKDDLKEVVFVLRDGKVKMVEVKTGISDFDNIEILSGLQEGDMVVTGPFLSVSKKLKDGDAAQIKEEDDKKKDDKKKGA